MEQLKAFAERFVELLLTPLFHLGESAFSAGTFLYLIGASAAIVIGSKWLGRWLRRRLIRMLNLSEGPSHTVATLTRYSILVLGLLVVVQSAGINISSLSLLAGALGVGIGFGLQNVADNFVSGLIILLEAPVKVGDHVEVGSLRGNVTRIAARSTTILTNDNISVIVPNSQFISNTVINWSHNDERIRFRLAVGVSYSDSPEQVREVLLAVAQAHQGVLDKPAPDVWFAEFGDSSLNFELLVWTDRYTQIPNKLKSELYFEVFKRFNEEGIQIPFPQRDLHLRSGWPGPSSEVSVNTNEDAAYGDKGNA